MANPNNYTSLKYFLYDASCDRGGNLPKTCAENRENEKVARDLDIAAMGNAP